MLANWLAANASLNEVLSTPAVGLAGNTRFTEWARHKYVLLWTWSAPRFAGLAGRLQDRLWSTRGPEALDRRIQRVRRIVSVITHPAV